MSLGDFETKKKNLQEQIAAAETEAQFTMDMSEVEKLNKQLEVLEANKLAYEDRVTEVAQDATEPQVKQITELGGSEEVLHEKVEAKNEEAKTVEEEVKEKSERVYIETEREALRSEIEIYRKKMVELDAIPSYKWTEENEKEKSENERLSVSINERIRVLDTTQNFNELKEFNFEGDDFDKGSTIIIKLGNVSEHPELVKQLPMQEFSQMAQKGIDQLFQKEGISSQEAEHLYVTWLKIAKERGLDVHSIIPITKEVLRRVGLSGLDTEDAEELLTEQEIKEHVEQIDGHKNNTGLENQIKQITELGGTEEELVKREEVQDEKVEEVKEVLEKNAEEGVIDVALFEKVSNMKSIKECSSIKEYNTYYEIRKKELDEKKEEIKELRNSIEKMKEGEIDKAVQTEMDVLDSKIGDIASQVYNTREECLEYPAFKFLEDVLNSVFKENPEKVVESILGGSRMNYLENMSKNYSLFRKEEGNNYIIGGGTDTDQVAKLLKKQMEIIQEKELVSVEKINQAIDQVVIKLLGDDKKDYVPVIDMINNSGLSDTYKEYAKKTFFENFDKNSLSGHRTIQDLENALN